MIDKTMEQTLLHSERLKLIREWALVPDAVDDLYNRCTQLAARAIAAPIVLLSIVVAEQQFFKGCVGLPETYHTTRRTPLSLFFCRSVIDRQKPLIVEDTRQCDALKSNPVVGKLQVMSYLGVPLTLEDGSILGSFCVIRQVPHRWTHTEMTIIENLAALLTRQFELQALTRVDRLRYERFWLRHQEKLTRLFDALEDVAQLDFLDRLLSLRDDYAV